MKIFGNFRFAAGFFAAVMLVALFTAPFFTKAQDAAKNNQNDPQRPRQAAPAAKTTPTPPVLSTPQASPTPEEDDDGVLSVETSLINLNVRVVDRNGRVVGDVRQDEFKVFEDNVPQKIEFFTREEVPVNYGLVVDNSGSLRQQLEKVIEAGKILVNANKPEDETFLIRFISSDKIEVLQDFTKEKNALLEAVDGMYVESGQTAVVDAVMLAAEKASEYEKSVSRDDRKRRALILVTDGEDRNSFYKKEQLFARLREADVQIYAIGFVNELDTEKSLFKKSDKQEAMNLLERMAKETGGKAYFPTSVSELPNIAREINSEMRTQYILGYSPTNENKDGTYRSVKVLVNDDARRGKRIAITRSGYTAQKN